MKIRVLLLAALATLVAAPATAAAPSVEIHPAKLSRGDNARVPYLSGQTIIDRNSRLRTHGVSYLLGRSGTAYIVVGDDGGLIRLEKDGSRVTRLARLADDADPLLSSDGRRVVSTHYLRGGRTRVTVFDAVTGERLAVRTFKKYASMLDAYRNRVVLTASAPDRTIVWNYRAGTSRRAIGRIGGTADIAANRLATLTGDPYDGGCTVVSSLRHPRRALWRSCQQAVLGFSPDGARMATDYILADGLGRTR